MLTRHREGSLAELLAIALPLMVSTGSHSLMVFFDRLFLTGVGKAEISASLFAGLLSWTVLAIPLGTLGYVTTFVSQYHGAGDDRAARASVWQAIYLGLLLTVAMYAVIPFSHAIFGWIDHEAPLPRLEADYFQIIMLATGPRLLIGAFFCHFSGRGETSIPMAAGLFGNVSNIGFTYLLVFGIGGFPRLGLTGAAWGTALATILELLFYFAFIAVARPETVSEWWAARGLDLNRCRRLVRFGLPAGLQMFSDASAFTVSLMFVGRLGEDAAAATTLALSINGVVFVPLIGLGMAVGTIVGHRVGAGRPEAAVATVWQATRFGVGMMGLFALCCLFAPQTVLWPFEAFGGSDFASLKPTMTTLFRFMAAFAIFDSLAVVHGAAIRGAGDTFFSLVVLVLAGWLLLALPITLLSLADALTLNRCWFALTGTIAAQGLIFLVRFLRGRWKSMTVLESTP